MTARTHSHAKNMLSPSRSPFAYLGVLRVFDEKIFQGGEGKDEEFKSYEGVVPFTFAVLAVDFIEICKN